jgi:hypothetical protein
MEAIMARFLVLSRRVDFPLDMSPEEMQRIIARYRSWTESVRATGRLVDAAGLRACEGRVVRERVGKLSVTDGPFAEAKEIVGGYWLIEAASYDEVLALTRDHPVLQTGVLEIRQLL